MRLPLPFKGSYRISQHFGERPEVYAKWNLPGHEGLDFALPEGTPVLAVDDGQVALASDKGAYGLHYRLVHAWGESVYAHLSKLAVKEGQRVGKGQVIGLSGNTGNSEGPHLHFGLRVAPFFRDGKGDKWQGFCDPESYFQPYRNPISPHIVNGNGAMLDALRRWQPAAATVLDPDPGFVTELKQACPNTRVVGRIYRADSEVADQINRDPIAAGAWIDHMIRSHAAFGSGVDYWQVANEVCQGEWEPFTRLNYCMRHWLDLAGSSYKCGLFAFGVGNPEAPVNDPAWWRELAPTLAAGAAGGHVLLLHEYGCKPGIDGPLDASGKATTAWRAQRYVNQVRPYPYVPRSMKVIIGEFGYDGLLMGASPSGWQESGLSAEEYANILLDFGDHYGRYRDQVLGVCVYTWGHNAPWGTYDIAGEVVERLAQGVGGEDGGRPTVVGGTEDGGQTTEDGAMTEERAAALAAGRGVKRLSLNPDAALQKAIVAVGYAPTSDEFGFTVGGQAFVGQWGERLKNAQPGKKAHVFYCPMGNWLDVRHVEEGHG